MQRGEGTPAYYVFDLLELERQPVSTSRWSGAASGWKAAVAGNPVVRVSTGFADGAALLAAVRAQDLEGVVAKRHGSVYRPGRRSTDWLKVKTRQDGEFLILGWTRGEGSREALGALVLGERGPGGLGWVGNVGSGLDERTIAVLLDRLRPSPSSAAAVTGAEDAEDAGAGGDVGEAGAALPGGVRRAHPGRAPARTGVPGAARRRAGRRGARPRAPLPRDPDQPGQGVLPRRGHHQGRRVRVLRDDRAGGRAPPERPAVHDAALSRRHQRQALLPEGRAQPHARVGAHATPTRTSATSS